MTYCQNFPRMEPLYASNISYIKRAACRTTSTFCTTWPDGTRANPPSSDDVFDTLCRAESLSFEPGSRYAYCDSNYFLLAQIIERVTGERFAEFARSRILDPLEMTSAYISTGHSVGSAERNAKVSTLCRAEGYVEYAFDLKSPFLLRTPELRKTAFHPVQLAYAHAGAEGLYASTADLTALAAHIVSPSLLPITVMRDHILHAPCMRDAGFGYAYGLNVGTYRDRRFAGHDGQIWGYTASLAVFPDDGFEVICMSNRADIAAWEVRSRIMEALDSGCVAKRKNRAASVHDAPHDEYVRHLLGVYLNPETASFLEIDIRDGRLVASLNGGEHSAIESSVEGGTLRLADGRTISADMPHENGHRITVRTTDGCAMAFERFRAASGQAEFLQYEGAYSCKELATTFDVHATDTGVRLRNRDRSRPSMDLDYTPTVRGFFWSRDPYSELSQIEFLRRDNAIHSFIYRDLDGDQRERFRFVRVAS